MSYCSFEVYDREKKKYQSELGEYLKQIKDKEEEIEKLKENLKNKNSSWCKIF